MLESKTSTPNRTCKASRAGGLNRHKWSESCKGMVQHSNKDRQPFCNR
jgi:hypothetical protein